MSAARNSAVRRVRRARRLPYVRPPLPPTAAEYGYPERLVRVAASFGACPCPVDLSTLRDALAAYDAELERRRRERIAARQCSRCGGRGHNVRTCPSPTELRGER